MPALETALRRTLERKIIEARDTAEAAAEATFDRLLVDNKNGGQLEHLSDDERKLRKLLLAKEKQLGSRDALVRECAYEQWHGMLFARFLEANGLLVHPEHQESVTLTDLSELAAEEGDDDAYATAARYAAAMLPGIFRPTDPLLQVRFAREYRQKLEELLEEIPKPAYTADDGLGWVYQFWQTKQKQEINASGRKIEGADIPPVTQLFTEHYMVQFMLHNTIGAWWVSRNPGEALPTDKSYLRLKDDGRPAAGSFAGWPTATAELKIIDPCCGSGHFLVAAFALLKRLRMFEEGLSEAEAGEAVLRDNLFGLELDPRCTQLAAFNLTLEAWKNGGYRLLPTPNIACSGLSISASVDDWLQFANDANTRNVFRALHEEFQHAPDLGSLINPREGIRQKLGMYSDQALDGLPNLIDTLLSGEKASDPVAAIFGENVQGVAKAAKLLGDTYHLVITNVPYLGRGKQGDTLKESVAARHPAAKADLATAFVERARDFAKAGGRYSLVTPQNWLFLGSYKKLREDLLKGQQWDWVARLGEHAFESAQAAGAFVALFSLTNKTPAKTHEMLSLDASAGKSVDEKDEQLRTGEVVMLGQEGQKGNPDSKVVFSEKSDKRLLSEFVTINYGSKPGQTARVVFEFWNLPSIDGKNWIRAESTPEFNGGFSGKNYIVYSPQYAAKMNVEGYGIRSRDAWGRKGIVLSQMRLMPCSPYLGEYFDNNTSVVLPNGEKDLTAIYAFMLSDNFRLEIRKGNQKLDVDTKSMINVPRRLGVVFGQKRC